MTACVAAVPVRAAGAQRAPFTEWFQSVAASAQSLADGDAAAAAALAERAIAARPSGPATERARLALGLALRAAGRVDEGVRLVRGSVSAIDARITAQVLEYASPPAVQATPLRAAPPIAAPAAPPDPLQVAEALVLDARPREALEALASAGGEAGPPDRRDRAALLRAWALMQLGRRSEAESLARGVLANRDADAGTRLGAELVVARVASREGRIADAIARYDLISTRSPLPIPGLPPATARDLPAEAAYLAAWLPFDGGQWARAAEDLLRFAERWPKSPRAVDARWFAAWANYRLGRKAAAAKIWADLERTSLAPGALYWRARVSPPARARSLYRKAIDAEPGGWYAFLAAGRLAALGERNASALPHGTRVPPLEEPTVGAEAMARATALLELGLREAAIAQLHGVASGSSGRAAAAHVAQFAEAAGEAELTFRIARDLLPLSRRSLRWQHPLAYGAGLDALAQAAGVDPNLFRALIRRESTFRRDARSPAGAEGLVQLMPYTAERLAVLLGGLTHEPLDLRAPGTSLALGAAYLGLLSDRFADPEAVLAAYNGGPEPIAAWANARAGRPVDEAVEELPYRETRRYVKLVMAAHATYRHLHDGEPALLDGSRPLRRPRAGAAF